MAFVNARTYSESTGLSISATWRRLENLPRIHGPARRYFHLVDVLPTLAPRDRKADVVQKLFDVALPSRDGGVPTVAYPSVKRVEAFLNSEESERLHECRVSFGESLARQVETSELFLFYERCRAVLPYDGGTLRYVMLKDDSDLPNWNSPWAVEWSIATSQYEPLTVQEAA